MVNLRPYQDAAVAKVAASFAKNVRSVLVCAPTGSGKTIIATDLIRRHAAEGKYSVFIAPRRELIDQTAVKLDALGIRYGVLMADDPRRDMWANVQLASIDTLRSRLRRCGDVPLATPSLVIVDEAHLYVTKYRVDLLDLWPDAFRVGLTATPARKDGRGLRILFDDLIEVATVKELTEQRYLVPARYFSLSEPDLSRGR
jgi:superfamily II DNA or RNA helicase